MTSSILMSTLIMTRTVTRSQKFGAVNGSIITRPEMLKRPPMMESNSLGTEIFYIKTIRAQYDWKRMEKPPAQSVLVI